MLHYYFSCSSKDSEETTTVDQLVFCTEHQEKTSCPLCFSHEEQRKTSVFTVLWLMKAYILIKPAISNRIQLHKQHAPLYFCYLPQVQNNSKTFIVFINQSASFADLCCFPCSAQIFITQNGNQACL